MRKIRVPNPKLSEKTYLDADYATSDTTLTVVSNLGFADNYMVVVGEPGEENTEAKDATGITGNTTINLSGALKFAHNKATPVYKSIWESVVIESKTTGNWSELSVSEIDWDKPETIYIHTAGDDTYSYRIRFYNQFLNIYSEYSPTQTGAGFSRRQVGKMIENIRKKAHDPNIVKITDGEIIEFLQDGQTIIEAIKDDWWFLKVDTFKASNGIATVADTYRYSLATYTDLNYLERIRFNFNDGTSNEVYDLEPKDELIYDDLTRDQDRTTDDRVSIYKLVPPDSSSTQGYVEVDPIPKTSAYGTFYPEYYKKMTTLNDVADTTDIEIPMVLEDYALFQIHTILGNKIRARLHERRFYGPAPREERVRELTGIPLLEQRDKKQKEAVGTPKVLWNWQGRKAVSRMYSTRILDRDEVKEKYW